MNIGERLLQQGLISQDQLQIALHQQQQSQSLGDRLIQLGFIDPQQLQRCVSENSGVLCIEGQAIVPDPDALALLSHEFAQHYHLIPVSFDGIAKTLKLATVRPDDLVLMDRIKRELPSAIKIEPLLATDVQIGEAIDRYYGYELSLDGVLAELRQPQTSRVVSAQSDDFSQPIVRLVESLMIDAVKQLASDIHFEPEQYFIRIRYRLDGVLRQIRLLPSDIWPSMLVRLKVVCNMDIAESRLAQDGRCALTLFGREVDFRASSQPVRYGENFVLRILDRTKSVKQLSGLGLPSDTLDQLQLMISKPQGLFLVTGPTGSGKTTTLYSILNDLNSTDINIMTLEDPVEYPLAMARQTDISQSAGVTFASAMRSILRQDPDIILLGEIRDTETAQMAIRASMTGHRVFSTLHTNSALGVLPRLLDMGISSALLYQNLAGVIAQRLLRILCRHCRQPYIATAAERTLLRIDDQSSELYKASGCQHCKFTGYQGRSAVMEVLPFSAEIESLLLMPSPERELQRYLDSLGHQTLRQLGCELVKRGVTSLSELARVIDLREGDRHA